MTSCKSSNSATVKPAPADAPPITGKQWRLEKEMVAADNKEDYAAGAAALSTFDAFGSMEVSQLFYHHKLEMVPAGTMVGETGPSEAGRDPGSSARRPASGAELVALSQDRREDGVSRGDAHSLKTSPLEEVVY